MILLNQAGRNTHGDICAGPELFARDVMPELHAQVAAHDAWKAKVLAREIELDEIGTEQLTARHGAKAVTVAPAR